MKDMIEFVVKSLVDKPECVNVLPVETGSVKVFKIEVDISDKGRVIGKQGRIIKALRQLVSASSVKKGERCRVEVVS
ncbi:MAG: hypothetical protein BWY26_01616 [Elusimicrobia bacterium ADurb.Bin231]|nr:MAG: hypothetical protein BWY26_01616 [Elusimicrobia bacterium ADurb.Bin231]